LGQEFNARADVAVTGTPHVTVRIRNLTKIRVRPGDLLILGCLATLDPGGGGSSTPVAQLTQPKTDSIDVLECHGYGFVDRGCRPWRPASRQAGGRAGSSINHQYNAPSAEQWSGEHCRRQWRVRDQKWFGRRK